MPRLSDATLSARRRRLVDAAQTCVARDGALTARSVAAEAGVSVGAVYHHFSSLDALWGELAELRLVAGIDEVAARAPAGDDPLAWAVRALVCAPPLGVPERAGTPAPEGVRRVQRATIDEVLRAAGAAGTLGPGIDVEALAELLELLWDAVDRRVATGSLRTSCDRLAVTLTDLVGGGARPTSSR